MFYENTLKDFIDELASNAPAPGGGSAAALAGAIGTSLSAMVFNLTVGKKIYNEYDEDTKSAIDKALVEAEKSKLEFLELMDKDTEAFMKLMAAFKLPKTDEAEKAARASEIQKGYKKALEVPFEMAEKAFGIYSLIDTACRYGNKNAISDAGVAALMIQSAIEGAVLNVKINLSGIEDVDYKEAITKKCNEITSEGIKCRDEILAVVNKVISA
jgi:formiminotetrahydrofolate cyclodeaminase